jgi:gliding motility-associated-like protein
LDQDSDNDGIPDKIEKGTGMNPVDTDKDGTPDYLDTDADGDGILDATEDAGCTGTAPCTPTDTDGDGIPNFLDLDSDGDGISDNIEKGADSTPDNSDADSIPDYLDADSDGDGISDAIEKGTGSSLADTDGDTIPDYLDLDSDADGIPDSVEKGTTTSPVDTDSDGTPDFLDTDTDGDGIPDSVEDAACSGTACTPTDTDGDGIPNHKDLDSDGDGIPDAIEKGANGATPDNTDATGNPDYLDTDSDDDGIPDSIEKGLDGSKPLDTDGDGIPDYKEIDSDGDGIPDSIEKGTGTTLLDTDGDGKPDYRDTDSDNDGILDNTEDAGCTGTAPCTPTDTDGDGTPNYRDLDSDGDNKTDLFEGETDLDGDTIPNYLDTDADGDGVLDINDQCPLLAGLANLNGCPVDTDGDGVYDINDADDDNDGIIDTVEAAACSPSATDCDTDGDGIPNRIDSDSDNDGISDVIESNGTDTDGDGKVDGTVDTNGIPTSSNGGVTPPNTDGTTLTDPYDTDSDGDGISDAIEKGANGNSPVDTDRDGIPDYRDIDSDNDGIPDSIERGTGTSILDTDGDGIPDYKDTDSDGDGILDATEDAGCTGIVPCTPTDTDGDGIPNYRDIDSDGDGINDRIEKGTGSTLLDTDGDGTPNYLDIDSDNDGISDAIEKGLDPNNPVDTDGDGKPDYLDTDSDNDGIPDAVEKGTGTTPIDTDGDGIPNYRDTDSDGDAILDKIEDDGCTGTAPCTPTDTDGDGIPNYLDLDTDGDGKSDAIEKGTGPILLDSDLDGIPDYRDVDNLGKPDVQVTNKNVAVSGNLNTNDEVLVGSTYKQPANNPSNPAGATLVVNSNGTYTFTAPTPGKYIYYVPVCGPNQTTGCPVSPLEITVLDPISKDAPVANNDFLTMEQGTSKSISILANDRADLGTNLESSTLTVTTVPKRGTVIINNNGTVTYTPNPFFVGTDSLVYRICDNSTPTLCSNATLYFTIEPSGSTPVTTANEDYERVYANINGLINIIGNVLTNDINSASGTLTATLVNGPTSAQGTFTMNANGSFTFTPTVGFSGPVDIVYEVCSATPVDCAKATLHILVDPAATLVNDAATAFVNIPKTGNVSTNDVVPAGTTYGTPIADPTNPAAGSGAASSGAVLTMTANGTYTFTATVAGTYTYTVPVCAPGQTTNCPTTTIVFTVPLNTLVNDVATAFVNIPKTGNVSTNDVVPAGTTYGSPVADPSNPALGTGAASSGALLTMTANGTYTFTATVAGTYTYTVPVCAPGQIIDCPTTTIVFTVPVNTLVNDVATAYKNIPKTGNVSTNDVVPAGTSYGTPVADPTNPALGTGAASSGAVLTMTANGTYTFTATVAGTYTYTVPVCAPGQTTNCPTETLVFNVPENKLANDTAIAYLNLAKTGNVATNDLVPAGTTYGTPTAGANNPALGTGAASSGAVLTMSTTGTYTFTATVAGTYTYTVPVCAPGQTTNCPTETLVFNVPENKLANDTVTAYLNLAKTGNVATNDVTPTGTTYGTPIADPTNPILGNGAGSSGAILTMTANGTYTFTATVAGTYTYTIQVCAPGQTTNCPTTTIVFTVIGNNPQGTINLKYNTLLASDSVHVKLKAYDGVGPYTMIFKNSINSRIDTVKNIKDSATILLPPFSNNAVFTIIKIIDSNNSTRLANFDKDTANLTILRPKILLTLKADLPSKLPDNSFKTKIVMKIKNNGGLYLQNVQVEADLSKVFPPDMQFVLDSVKVTSGNLALNPTYSGFGAAKAPSYTAKVVNGFSIKYRALSTLSGSELFNNGVNLDINEEGSVVFYLTLKPGVNIDPLVLQFTTAGDGLLVQKDGNKSMQPTTSISHDNSNINAHPSLTDIGKPLPTYIPFFLVNEIGASLEASQPDTVNGGYVFRFKSIIKNYSNSNLDSVAASFDINQFIKVPDSASIYGTPTVVGTSSFNPKFDGKNDIQLFKGVSQLKVGDSIKITFDLFVKTAKTKAIWPTYLIAKGITTTGDLRVTDTSTNGSNPDPNGNKIPNESVRTIIGIGLTPPPAPEVIPAVYEVDDKRNPKNIGQLVKKIPIGTVPTWCNVDGTACSIIPPILPNIVGTYIWCVKSLDTVTGLSSTPCVYDTVRIIPINKYSKYDLIKSAKNVEYDLSGKFIIGFNFKVVNNTDRQIDSILIQDDLTKTFKRADGYKLISISSSGTLLANNAFDGISNIELLKPASYLAANSSDSIVIKILIESESIDGDFNNAANMKIWSDYGKLDLLSNDTVVNKNGLTNRVATKFIVPKILLNIPEGFSPNNDGIDDTWFIKHPFGMKLDVKVVNRWGNEVYANPDYKNEWRGKGVKNFLGEDLPEGTYYYIVRTIDRNGVSNKFAGPLTIIR